MFWCVGDGGHFSKPGQKAVKVVTQIRETMSNHFIGVSPDESRCRLRVLDCPGFETAQTIQLCPDCLSEAPHEPEIINPDTPKRIEQTVFRSSARK